MAGDNWVHKAKGMVCEKCMWYIGFRCRKNAPTLNGWPAVFPSDWCGDHKLDKDTMMEMIGDVESSVHITHCTMSVKVRPCRLVEVVDSCYECKACSVHSDTATLPEERTLSCTIPVEKRLCKRILTTIDCRHCLGCNRPLANAISYLEMI